MNTLRKPRYFHLLWDEDLEELREVLTRLRDRRAEVVSTWYRLYLLHFGDERALSESDFRSIFEPALLRNQEALLRKDMDAYAASVLMTGKQLTERQVPLDELIAAVQLLEEAAQTVFPQDPPPSTDVYNKFDKLSHIRIILLVAAYSRMQSASAATRISALELEAKNLPAEQRTRFHGLVGHSAVMRDLYRQIEAAGRFHTPVLMSGESGSGKEMVARAIHECGPNSNGPFVVLRCEALPSYLVENELFGYRHQKNNGPQTYLGLLGAAEGGTLFLDEISRLPVNVQEKLAHTASEPRSHGAHGAVRLLASTRRNLEEALRVGQVRHDFGRLFEGNAVQVPPLRERRADVAVLARHFIDLFNRRTVRPAPVAGIDRAALEMMERYAWPGNVRELLEAIEKAFDCARSEIIGPADLPPVISGINGHGKRLPSVSFETFADAERAVLQRALEITGGNKLRAARLLKISRKKLYSGIAKYGLKPVEA